jgi:hypothetical protein
MKTIYAVFGYANTGSGSLTFPEDFDFKGFFEVKSDAQAYVDALNTENGVDEGGEWLDDGEAIDPYDGTVYTFYDLNNLKK